MSAAPVGLLLGSHLHPSAIAPMARQAESGGFGELWVTEDLWCTSGPVCATAALAATSRISVGLGVTSVVTRHSSIQALDFGTIAHMFPGRFLPGVGLGDPGWLDQMGLRPASSLRALREVVETLRGLLAGDTVSRSGAHHLRDIALAYPLSDPPPVYVGAIGPKSVRQAGEIADGLIVSNLSSPAYVRRARELVDEGSAAAGRTERLKMPTFAFFAGDTADASDLRALREIVAVYLRVMSGSEIVTTFGIQDELTELLATGGPDLADRIPRDWLDGLAIIGNAATCARQIEERLAAGADSVVLFPVPFSRADALIQFASERVLPLVGST